MDNEVQDYSMSVVTEPEFTFASRLVIAPDCTKLVRDAWPIHTYGARTSLSWNIPLFELLTEQVLPDKRSDAFVGFVNVSLDELLVMPNHSDLLQALAGKVSKIVIYGQYKDGILDSRELTYGHSGSVMYLLTKTYTLSRALGSDDHLWRFAFRNSVGFHTEATIAGMKRWLGTGVFAPHRQIVVVEDANPQDKDSWRLNMTGYNRREEVATF